MAVLPCWADRCVQVALCSVPRDDPFGFCPVVVFVSMCRYVFMNYILLVVYFFIHTNTTHHLLRYHQNLRVRLGESSSRSTPIWEWWIRLLLLLHVVDNTDSSGRSAAAAAAAAEDCRYRDAYYPLGVGSS